MTEMPNNEPKLDRRMRRCPACNQYVMPQKPKVGWGGILVTVLAPVGLFFGGLLVKFLVFPLLSLLAVSWIVFVAHRMLAKGSCPICKGPVAEGPTE